MLRLSNTTRKTAFAAVLGTGLMGSAAVVLTPLVAQAQQWHRETDDRGLRDDQGFRGDRDDRGFRRDWDDRWRFGAGVGGVGFGVYGYPYYGYHPYYSGYYEPYANYGPYCSSSDYYYGYCSY